MLKEVEVGDQVALNNLPDAAWFDVLERDGFRMTIREVGNSNYVKQVSDVSLVKQIRKGKKE